MSPFQVPLFGRHIYVLHNLASALILISTWMFVYVTGILGPFPPHVLNRGKETPKYFTQANFVYERTDQGFTMIYPKRTTLPRRLHLEAYPPLEYCLENGIEPTDEAWFVDFVNTLLHLDPYKRPKATEALRHPWLRGAYDIDFANLPGKCCVRLTRSNA
jgi:serine/threonine protein kinase